MLTPHRFTHQREKHGVIFRRTLRGFPNVIVFDTDDMGSPELKRARFTLYAPKAPLGLPSNGLPGGQFWWPYRTQEDLLAQLGMMRDLLINHGLQWFDLNTPGNVPQWEHLVDQLITPMLASLGFTVSKGKHDGMDTLRYVMVADPKSRVFLDFRNPGIVSCGLSRYRTSESPLEAKVGPSINYGGEADLSPAVEQLRDWLALHVPKWFGGEDQQDKQL